MNGLIGHTKVLDFFTRAEASGKLHHAFLLVGPNGVGKTHLMHLLSARFLECQVEKLPSHPNVMELRLLINEKTGKTKTQVTVDQIRELRTRLSMSALGGGYQVAIIEDAHAMNTAAQNALLKILEQPTGKVIFFLRATTADELLPTITSRCQLVRLGHVPSSTIAEALITRGASSKEASEVTALAMGCPGRALELFMQPRKLAEEKERAELMLEQLNKPTWQNMRFAGSMVPRGKDAREVMWAQFKSAQTLTRDLMLSSIGVGNTLTNTTLTNLPDHARARPPSAWANELVRQMKLEHAASLHVDPTLLFENLLMHLSYEY